MKMHKIELIYGDTSHDGHRVTDTWHYLTNYDVLALRDAYKSCKTYWRTVSKTVDSDRIIDKENLDKLIAHGYPIGDNVYEDGYIDDYPVAWLEFVKLALPDLQYEYKTKHNPNIDIGGYGMLMNN